MQNTSNSEQKFGLMVYPANPTYNVGDYVQSLAAKQYLPKVDVFVEREKLKSYKGDDIKMIMNGWYILNPDEFPPSAKINPLWVSFHLNANAKDKVLTPETIAYLKEQGPIGCRDTYTLSVLQEKGIDSYFSGCITTTLDVKYKTDKKSDKVYMADPLFLLPHWGKMMYGPNQFIKAIISGEIFRFGKRKRILKQLITDEFLENAEYVKHKLSGSHSEERRFEEAEALLHKFAAAKLVVTSRIHCALPCLALGTPVIFINYGFNNSSDMSRFSGISDLFNTININDKGEIQANFDFNGKIGVDSKFTNPTRHVEMAVKLKEKAFAFVK
ncbi:hypothetical protein ACVW0P_003520 [Mucilaginibacter sp. UYNi724]